MKFLVTCLNDRRERVLASRSKVFDSLPEAIVYGGSVSGFRSPAAVHVHEDPVVAAELIFDNIVETQPGLITENPDDLKKELRYEEGEHDYVAVFTPDNDMATAFIKYDTNKFIIEIERLILESGK